MPIDQEDGKIENASTPTRILGKESESSTQHKRQVTVTRDIDNDKVLMDVASQSRGLSVAGLVTEVSIDDASWTPLPATPLVGRNAMAIQNKTGFRCKVKYTNVGGYTDGMIIEDNEEREYDITGNVIIYARAEAGAGSITLFVEELA